VTATRFFQQPSGAAESFSKRLSLFFSCFFCLVSSFFLFSLLNAPGLANVPPLGQIYFYAYLSFINPAFLSNQRFSATVFLT